MTSTGFDEHDRSDRAQPPPAPAGSALPGLVGSQAPDPLPSHHRAGDRLGWPRRSGLRRRHVRLRRLEPLFVGEDPLDLERHHAVLSNIDFHAGRPWPLDVALWDLAGKIQERPVWDLVGGRNRRVRAYASSAVHRPVPEMVEVALRARSLGFPALKVRFGRPDLSEDLAVVSAIRERGDSLDPGRLQPGLADSVCPGRRDGRHAARWPQRRADRSTDGGALPGRLRGPSRAAAPGRHPLRGGEMTREPYELRSCLRGLPRRVPPYALHGGSPASAPGPTGRRCEAISPPPWANGRPAGNLHLTLGRGTRRSSSSRTTRPSGPQAAGTTRCRTPWRSTNGAGSTCPTPRVSAWSSTR